jgi:hypothetical protein
MKHLLLQLLVPVLLFPAFCFGQGDQTIINVPLDSYGHTEKAILHLPDDYGKTTTKYPLLVFLHGIGEAGTNPATIYNSSTAGGPAYYIAQGKFPSSFVNPKDKQSYKYIVLSPQNATNWSTSAQQLDVILTYILAQYRVDPARLYLTGLSAGGEGVTEYVGQIATGNVPVITTHKIAAFMPMSAAIDGTFDPQYAKTIVANNVGTWGFGSPLQDLFGAYTINLVNDVNAIKPGFAVGTSYSGGHCCWGQFYDPNFKQNGMSMYEWALQYTQGTSAPPSTTPAQPTAGPYAVPGKVESENYAAMSGVATETTTDAGAGQDVGWIDQGDYMDYSVNVATAGQYTVSFRVASPNAGASFQMTTSSGSVLATVNVPTTGGWQTWQTVTANVTLPAGIQTLRIKSVAASAWNFNYMQFATYVPPTTTQAIPGTIQAESYSSMSGVATQSTTDAGGGLNVGWIDAGDHMDYSVNVATAGQYTASFRMATANSGGSVQLMTTAGTVLATATVPNTGGWQTWQTVTANVTLPAGVQTIRVKCVGTTWNFNWMQFVAAASTTPSTKIEAESYSSMYGVSTETTTDAGAGLDVIFKNGNWAEYAITASTAGQYKLDFRVAAVSSGAALQLWANGNNLGTLGVPQTGGSQVWNTASITVTLPAGKQTVRVVATASPVCNVNWLQVTKATTTTAVEGDAVNRSAAFMSSDSTTAAAIGGEFNLFPNPVHDQVTLRLNNDQTGNMLVQITDAFGATRASYSFSKTASFMQVNLATSNLPAGIYFVRIQVGNKGLVKKIVKL